MINQKNSVNEIRKTFINYFKTNNHQVISSSNLVPENDPTLLFTNAGMVQFKNIFTGLEHREYNKAVSSQKCLRAGGKHNDLENVGRTARHHTFFEMLGNFSFGDYFKEKAIHQAWELLTKEYAIPKEKLLVTIYHNDKEAEELWKKISGFKDDKIIKIKTSDNFWSMGDTGPCGPCSEIFYDHGNTVEGGPPGSKNEDGDRFIEIWNLVFMQYEQISNNKRISLPKPSIDTGMGLERISALLQNTHNNYETDMMKNLVNASAFLTSTDENTDNIISHRVVADHLRSMSFLIAEGVLPSNEGRGYVLRRIMRRAMRHTHLLGALDPVIYKLVEYLIKEMGEAFPELVTQKLIIEKIIREEEIKFKDTLDRGMSLLLNEIDEKVSSGVLSGEKAFELYDTYGFPIDLTEDVLRSYGWTVDHSGFESSMNNQKNKARQAWSGSGDKQYNQEILKVLLKLPSTDFQGYDNNFLETQINLIIKNNEIVKNISCGDKVDVIFNKTIFYAESGGQIADKGSLEGVEFKANVLKTKKINIGNNKNIFISTIEVLLGSLQSGDIIKQLIELDHRKQLCSHHSATHLLHEALRQKLDGHGNLNLMEAIEQSCDVFFYELGLKVGIDKIALMMKKLGLGQYYDIQIHDRAKGVVPNIEWKLKRDGLNWSLGETLNASIGQGYILTTPLQLVTMVSRIANGKFSVNPSLTMSSENKKFKVLNINNEHLHFIKRAMEKVVVGKKGTARNYKIGSKNIEMAGKTGTVQVVRITELEREQGLIKNEDRPWEKRDHALFVGYAPTINPRYAISVVVEHGGSGSSVAAPIARDVFKHLFKL